MDPIVEKIIAKLGLLPHPIEGGFFVETYRSTFSIPAETLGVHPSSRSLATAIYYLLTPHTVSEMHLLPTDEIFHFYAGDPVEMLQLWPDGSSKKIVLGNQILQGHMPQLVVPGHVWQGSWLLPGGNYALLGATMAPGFDYQDYIRGNRSKLTEQYPSHRDLIAHLTPGQ